MKSLGSWSRRAIIGMWAWWVGGLVTIVVILSLVAYWRVQHDVAVSRHDVTSQIGYLPPQSTDVRISVVWPELALALALLFGPPGVVTLLWWQLRNGYRDQPT